MQNRLGITFCGCILNVFLVVATLLLIDIDHYINLKSSVVMYQHRDEPLTATMLQRIADNFVNLRNKQNKKGENR